MQDQILQVDENMLETRLDRLVSEKVEQLLNAEADEITGAARYERTGDRKAYRVGHYERDLTVKAGTVTLKVPKLKGALFESAVIERYRRREQSVEEALIDMYLAGVSTRQVDDISRLLWGERMLYFVKSVFRVSSLVFFGFRHEECRPVVCFTGCPSCRT